MSNPVLFQWGPIQFQVFPFGVNEYSHHTGADWAKKEIAGAAMYREWVGEGEEQITVKGRIFPHFFARKMRSRTVFRQPILENVVSDDPTIDPNTGLLSEPVGQYPTSGGLMHLDVLDNMRRLGQAHILVRGDGWHFGWYIIETLNRGHSLIARDGIGQQVEFEASFQRVPIPNDPATGVVQLFAADIL